LYKNKKGELKKMYFTFYIVNKIHRDKYPQFKASLLPGHL